MFEFIIQTGFDSGFAFARKHFGAQQARTSNGYQIDNLSKTGVFTTEVSLNSQFLCEDIAEEFVDSLGKKQYQNQSDFFIATGQGPTLRKNNTVPEGSLIVDVGEYRPVVTYVGNSSDELVSGLLNAISLEAPEFSSDLNDLEFFINGQKVYEPDIEIDNGTGLQINFDVSGRIFAKAKSDTLVSLTGQQGFLSGVDFIEGRVNICAFGLGQNQERWIEATTGVNTIEFDLNSKSNSNYNFLSIVEVNL